MVSSGCKTGIVATVTALGAIVIILASTLGWIWYPNFVNKVHIRLLLYPTYYVIYQIDEFKNDLSASYMLLRQTILMLSISG